MFLWEAFISGSVKASSHIGDAELGVSAFVGALSNLIRANALQPDVVHSLIGAALLRTGWATDLLVLGLPCVVIKA